MGSGGFMHWLSLCAAMLGCAQAPGAEPEQRVECREDGDCANEQLCQLGIVETPIVIDPCAIHDACPADGQCPNGMVCATNVPVRAVMLRVCPGPVCVPDCARSGCAGGLVCSDDSVCRPRACELPKGASCAAHYRCDPEAALAELRKPLRGSTVVDSSDPYTQAELGCVRKTCEQADGFVCKPDWACEPALAEHEASGCMARPCMEIGHCEDDERNICLAVNDGTRATSFDPHGCVVRTCQEGYRCPADARCAVGEFGADPFGCKTEPVTVGLCVDRE